MNRDCVDCGHGPADAVCAGCGRWVCERCISDHAHDLPARRVIPETRPERQARRLREIRAWENSPERRASFARRMTLREVTA